MKDLILIKTYRIIQSIIDDDYNKLDDYADIADNCFMTKYEFFYDSMNEDEEYFIKHSFTWKSDEHKEYWMKRLDEFI